MLNISKTFPVCNDTLKMDLSPTKDLKYLENFYNMGGKIQVNQQFRMTEEEFKILLKLRKTNMEKRNFGLDVLILVKISTGRL